MSKFRIEEITKKWCRLALQISFEKVIYSPEDRRESGSCRRFSILVFFPLFYLWSALDPNTFRHFNFTISYAECDCVDRRMNFLQRSKFKCNSTDTNDKSRPGCVDSSASNHSCYFAKRYLPHFFRFLQKAGSKIRQRKCLTNWPLHRTCKLFIAYLFRSILFFCKVHCFYVVLNTNNNFLITIISCC